MKISDSSLAFDRIKKARLYGRAGFPERWMVNLRERSLIVHKHPYAGARFSLASVLLPGPTE